MKLNTFIEKQLPILLPYLIIGIGGFILYKRFFNGDAIKNGESFDPSNLKLNNSLLTKSLEALKVIADNQYLAMNKYGTDTQLLFESLSNLNAEDLRAVNKFFGKRCSTISLFPGTSQCISPYLNLFQWYNEELGESDLIKINELWLKSGLL